MDCQDNLIKEYFIKFVPINDPQIKQHQKATEAFLLMLILYKEKRLDDFIHKAGQFIEQSLNLILEMLQIQAYHSGYGWITNNDSYLALTNRSLLNKNSNLKQVIQVARCIYKIRDRNEHELKKIAKNDAFLVYFLILLFLIQINIFTLKEKNKLSNESSALSELNSFIQEISKQSDISFILNQRYLIDFLRILNLNNDNIEQTYELIIIPDQDLKSIQGLIDYFFNIFNDNVVSLEIFNHSLLNHNEIEIYKGASLIFPFESISGNLIQKWMDAWDNKNEGTFRFGGPILADIKPGSYIFIPKISQEILTNLWKQENIKLKGKSGLGKSTLAKILGLFYSQGIYQINLDEPFNSKDFSHQYNIPVYYFDFYRQDSQKIKNALHTLNLIAKSNRIFSPKLKTLLIFDNLNLIPYSYLNIIETLVKHYLVLLIEKTESKKSNTNLKSSQQNPLELLNINYNTYDLDKNESYIEDIIAGILYKANPKLDFRYFVDQILHKDRFNIFNFTENKDIEENLWTITFLARIIHSNSETKDFSLGFYQLLSNFQLFNNEIMKFIDFRFEQMKIQLKENGILLNTLNEQKYKDNLELILIIISVFSQLEIPIERNYFYELNNIKNQTSNSLLSKRLKNIDYEQNIAFLVIEYLTKTGEIFKKEGFNKESEYILPHQKLAIILKSSLLYPFNSEEIRQFQKEIFISYIETGRNFGDLIRELDKLPKNHNGISNFRIKFKSEGDFFEPEYYEPFFYLRNLFSRLNPNKLLTQLTDGSLIQIIESIKIISKYEEMENNNFKDFNEKYQKSLPEKYRTIIQILKNTLQINNKNLIDFVISMIFKRNISSTSINLSLQNIDDLHYIWFHYSNIPEIEWNKFVLQNQVSITEFFSMGDLKEIIARIKYELEDEERAKEEKQRIFYLSLISIIKMPIVNAFSEIIEIDQRIIQRFLKPSIYGDVLFQIIKRNFENKLKRSKLYQAIEVFSSLKDIPADISNTKDRLNSLIPSNIELIQILSQILETANIKQIFQFLNLYLKSEQKSAEIERVLNDFIRINKTQLISRIKNFNGIEILKNFINELNLNSKTLDQKSKKTQLIRELFQDSNWLMDKIIKEINGNEEELAEIYYYLEILISIIPELNIKKIEEKISNDLIEYTSIYGNMNKFEEFLNTLFNKGQKFKFSNRFNLIYFHILFENQGEKVIELFFSQSLEKIIKFFLNMERCLISPNIENSHSEMKELITEKLRDLLYAKIILPSILKEIQNFHFDCIESLEFSMFLKSFIIKLLEDIEKESNIIPIFHSFKKYEIITISNKFELQIPFLIVFEKNFKRMDIFFFNFLKAFDEFEQKYYGQNNEESIQKYLNEFRVKIQDFLEMNKKGIEKSFALLFNDYPNESMELLFYLSKYNHNFASRLILINKKVLFLTLESNNLLFLCYGSIFWYLFLSHDSRPIDKLNKDHITKFWDKQLKNINAVQFEIFCLLSYLAFKRGFFNEDISNHLKELWTQTSNVQRIDDVSIFLTAIKCYEDLPEFKEFIVPYKIDSQFRTQRTNKGPGIGESVNYMYFSNNKQEYYYFFKDIHINLPKESTGEVLLSDNIFKDYISNFATYFKEDSFEKIISIIILFYGGPNLEYKIREKFRLIKNLQKYLFENITILFNFTDFVSFHSYLSYMKIPISGHMVNYLKKSNFSGNLLDKFFVNFYFGHIPFSEKELEKLKLNNERIKSELKLVENEYIKDVTFLINLVKKTFDNEENHQNIFSNFLSLNNFILFFKDFSGIYFPITQFVIEHFDKYFEKTPQLLEKDKDSTSFSFVHVIYIIYLNSQGNIPIFANKFNKYKRFLIDKMQKEGAKSIQSILFQNFNIEFVQFILNEINSLLIDLLNKDNPIWNLDTFLVGNNKCLDFFLNKYKSIIEKVYGKPRIDYFFI